jgi:hypothetical protein
MKSGLDVDREVVFICFSFQVVTLDLQVFRKLVQIQGGKKI